MLKFSACPRYGNTRNVGTATHYPYITDGKGKGIIEEISPYELF